MASLGVSAPAASVNSPAAQERARPAPAEAPPTLDDGTIVAIFDNANTADIETGKLAAKRGHRKEVRQFGAMLARDHAHDGDDVAYWNHYVGVMQVHAHGSFSESRLGITVNGPPDMMSSKLGAL